MINSFLSIVSVIQDRSELSLLQSYLEGIFPILKNNFSDWEIILVNNVFGAPIETAVAPLPPELKQNLFLLNLSAATNRNHAIVAGLDRANGDYTLIFELAFHHRPEYILELFNKTQEQFDIVYLRAKSRKRRFAQKPFVRLFYTILKHYSSLQVDEHALDTRIISRRALNSLLKLRENLRYMKAIYSIVGYRTASIEINEPPADYVPEPFSEQFRTSLVAITSFTSFLRSLLLWIFIFSFLFLLGVIINALSVKFLHVDLFGTQHEALSGWTFLVILIAVFFAITCLNLYIMSIYLSNIYQEIKQRPLYIIESIKRF
jgi:hypothetical protein